MLAWFLGVCGTRREQQLFKYAGRYSANTQQCEFAFGNDKCLLALCGVRMFTGDRGCQALYLGGDPRITKGSGCETMQQSIASYF
jgi:hypothetical protein